MDETNYHEHPEHYRIQRGEIGVFHTPPYTDELKPLWRFATPDVARHSAEQIWAKFEAYRKGNDFVGMDVARKFLQMGYTRSRRYANHKGGRKYDPKSGDVLPDQPDPQKAESARIFKEYWDKAVADTEYQRLKAEHQERVKAGG